MRKFFSYILLVLSFIGVLGGCSSSVRFSSNKFNPKSDYTSSKSQKSTLTKSKNSNYRILPESKKANQIREIAQKWIGTPYCIAGFSKDCTDCSGFVQSVYKELGVNLPRTAKDQYVYTERIAESEAVTGDLVFFSKNGTVNHVGIYLSNGTFVHASSSKGVVIEELTTTYYNKNFAGFGRIREFYSMN